MVDLPTKQMTTALEPHTRLGQRPALGGLRGIAVSCVFIFHLSHMLFGDRPLFGFIGLPNGFLGVDIFFVLSGFLITSLLIEEHQRNGTVSLTKFYARRALRLLPALVCFLAVIGLYSWATLPARRANEVYASILYALFYSTNWIKALGIAPVADEVHHTWSLAIEEQFYLLWPLMLLPLFKVKISRRWMVAIVLFVVACVCVNRIWLSSIGGIIRVYEGSDTRADSLLIGCAAAMLFTWNMLPRGAWFKWALGFLCFISVLVIELFITAHIPSGLLERSGFTIFAFAVAVLLLQVVHAPPRILLTVLELPPLIWLGRISYAFYLWQIFGISLARFLPVTVGYQVAAALAFSLCLASLSFYLVERPMLKRKQRFQPADLRRNHKQSVRVDPARSAITI